MNKVILMGRLTRDPQITHTQDKEGKDFTIARFNLAVDKRGKKVEGQPEADFPSCVAFGRNGEFAEKYLKQGTKIALSGRLQTGSYTDKDGKKVYTTEVVVDEQEFAESKGTSQPSEEPAKANDGYMEIPEGIINDLPFK